MGEAVSNLERFAINILTNNPPRAMVPPALRVAMIALVVERLRARAKAAS